MESEQEALIQESGGRHDFGRHQGLQRPHGLDEKASNSTWGSNDRCGPSNGERREEQIVTTVLRARFLGLVTAHMLAARRGSPRKGSRGSAEQGHQGEDSGSRRGRTPDVTCQW